LANIREQLAIFELGVVPEPSPSVFDELEVVPEPSPFVAKVVLVIEIKKKVQLVL